MGACQSKKAFKAALKKRRMERLPKGQRSSSGGGAPLPKRHTAPNTPSQISSNGSTPKTSLAAPPSGSGGAPKNKKPLKASQRESTAKKTLPTQTRCRVKSGSSLTNSPASLHGRVLQKTTSTVSPAPPAKPPPSSSAPLTRFGFKSTPLITSGESTDSVNSILSDAQTNSDSNSNIFFSEENGNGNEPSDLIQSYLQTKTKESHNLRAASPCTISQASSGVTSTLLNGKLKAQTKQLPVPQVVTVKNMNNTTKSPSPSSTPRFLSPLSRKDSSPQRSPLVTTKVSKIPQTSTKFSPKTRISRDSESSNKSQGTADSGIGSSSESDRIRSSEPFPASGGEKVSEGSKADESNNNKKLDLDISDVWLKERRTQQGSKRNSGDLDLKFKDGIHSFKAKTNGPEKLQQKETFKEKRDSNITYGMARQKFAPYSRNRVCYQNALSKFGSGFGSKSIKKDDPPVVTLSEEGSVRSRIALLEKSPLNSDEINSAQKPAKKLTPRPTAIGKTPILVNPTAENTVELSRSICRKLEYSEGKSTFLDSLIKDNMGEDQLVEVPSTAEDLLMVDSFEVKKDPTSRNSENVSALLVDSELSVKLPIEKTIISEKENSECKRIKDISECENSTKRLTELPTVNRAVILESNDKCSTLQLPLSEEATKLISPDGSEISFEVLDSANLTPRDEKDSTPKGCEGYLSQLVAGFNLNSVVESSARHIQNSHSRHAPLKKCRQESTSDVSPKEEEQCILDDHESLDSPTRKVSSSGSINQSSPDCQPNSPASTIVVENLEDSSHCTDTHRMSDSNQSADNNRMSDSIDRWTISGKCTPTLSSARGDADQDFLIDDEISDQPGLTFGDELDESFFGDGDLFSDISSPSSSHILPKPGRSRHDSLGTASSIGADDLMLDYDLDDSKHAGQPHPVRNVRRARSNSASKKPEGKNVKNLEISIPGSRYVEDVLSPVACEILNEWSAILNESQQANRSSSHTCVSHQSVGVNTTQGSAVCPNLNSAPNTDINTHQPLSSAKDYAELPNLSLTNSFNRPRTTSVGPDFCTADVKKGVNFKPPRQGLSSEHDGGVNLDRTTLHYICQDVTAMKTLLLRLRRVIQVADTINPFDLNHKTSLYLNLGANESPEREELNSPQDVVQQNVDLKRQVVLLQQRLEEKDRTIRILQQQLSQALHLATSSSASPPNLTDSRLTASSDGGESSSTSNAATQTERIGHRASPFSLTSMSRTSSIEDGLGPTVSFESTRSSSGPIPEVLQLHGQITECETKKESSTKKKYSPEFHVSSSPKLSLVPAVADVAESLSS